MVIVDIIRPMPATAPQTGSDTAVDARPAAISYIRFSSPQQADGASLKRQLDATRAYCEREGLQLDENLDLRDLGISAWSGANAETGALSGLLELVGEGRIEPGTRLIVENIDRLSRQGPLDAFEIVRSLLKAGVVLVTLSDNQVYTSESINGGQIFILLGHMQRAYSESQSKSDRMRHVWGLKKRAAIEQGKPVTANTPAWLRISEDGQYELIPDAVATIHRIFKMSIEGLGNEAIAKTLHREGIQPIGRRADQWHIATIGKVLSNRQLLGEYQPYQGYGKDRTPAGDPIPGFFPQVIDKATFYAAQEAKARRTHVRGRSGDRVNLFSNLVWDSLGAKWISVRKGPRTRPQLASRAGKVGVPGHAYQAVPLEPFEEGLMILVKQLWERREPPTSDGGQRLAELRGEIADIDARLKALRDRIKIADPKTITTLIDLVPELEEQRAEYQAEAERLEANAQRSVDQLPSLVDELEANPQDRAVRLKVRQAIREHVEKVTILNIERQRSKWMTDPETGERYRPKAGQIVVVEMLLRGDEDEEQRKGVAGLFLPTKSGDLVVHPIKLPGGGSLLAADMADRIKVVATDGEYVVLQVGEHA
ncbi:MAG: recombinase family protein [Dehalococcoidia bacterium]